MARLDAYRDQSELLDVELLTHNLQWEEAHSGRVVTGLPWLQQPYKARIDTLEKAQKKLEKSWSGYPSEDQIKAIRYQYSDLRATIERVIQDIVFNGVVDRYRDWIKVANISLVVGFQSSEAHEIERLHKVCCDVTEAHDSSAAKNAAVPTPMQLEKDIIALKALVESIKDRRKNNP